MTPWPKLPGLVGGDIPLIGTGSKRGTIGILSGDLARYSEFWLDLFTLDKTGYTLEIVHQSSVDVVGNRNDIVAHVMKGDSEWLWFLDDDGQMLPDTLKRLLSHNVDIVAPNILRRKWPFAPVMMKDYRPHLSEGQFLMRGLREGDGGLLEVVATGTHGLLVKRRVFEAMGGHPWFQAGAIKKGALGEDLGFCVRARELGFKIYVDLDCLFGHIARMSVWPHRDETGKWFTLLKVGEHNLVLPAPIEKDREEPT